VRWRGRHAKGIRVLLDVVYNHAGYGAHYLTDPAFNDWIRHPEKKGRVPARTTSPSA